MRLQENTHIEDGQEKKYEVGRRLRFKNWGKEENFTADYTSPDRLRRGDVIRPVEKNACGMGIDVIRDSDKTIHMVWPEEVAVMRKKGRKRR